MENLESRVLFAAISWINSASGNWNNKANWSSNTVPGSGDDVTISQPGVTVTVSDTEAANSLMLTVSNAMQPPVLEVSGGTFSLSAASEIDGGLTLDGGNLSLGASLALDGTGTWSTASIGGPGPLNIGTAGAFTINGGSDKDMHNGLVVNNSGLITDAGSNQWRFFDGAVLNNLSGGVVNMTTGETIIESNGSINNEAGATFKNTGPGTETTVPFNNLGGTVEVDAGSFALAGGGTSSGGTFNVNGTASVLSVTGGSAPTWTGNYTGSGTGTVSLDSGTLNIGGAGATFNFPSGLFVWSGGSLSSNALSNTGFMTLSGGGTKDMVNALVLNNSGTITDAGSNQWRFFSGSVLNNLSGGVVNMTTGETIIQSNGTINNEAGATFKNTGPGSVTTVPFNNLGGTVEVDAGSFTLENGTSTGGIFNVTAAGAVLDITGGQGPTFTGTYTGAGAGTVQLGSGTLNIGAAGATFNFPAGYFDWSGGSFSSNTLTNAGFITLSGNNTKDMHNALVLDNTGTITDSGVNQWGFFDGSVLNNMSGGVVNMASGEAIIDSSGVVNNLAGATFKNTGPGSSTTVPFNNQAGAIVEVDAGTFTLAGGGTDTGGTFNVNGTGSVLNINGSSTPVWSGTYTGSGTGTVSLSGGTLQLGLAGATLNFPAGYFVWSGGSISGTAGGILTNVNSMTLSGNGTKDMHNGLILDNSGTIIDNGTNQWRFFDGSVLNNLNHGLVSLQSVEPIIDSSGSINNEAGATFDNNGPGSFTNVPFNNAAGAVIEVDSGSFSLNGGGSSTGGIFNVAEEATLNLTGNNSNTFGGVYTGAGKGVVALTGGTLNIAAGGATFDFPANYFIWTGGSIAGNTLANTGFMTLSGNSTKDMHSGLILNNSGTITDSGSNQWRFFDGSELNNQTGGVVNMVATESIIDSSGTIINRPGAVVKNTGPGLYINVPIDNRAGGIIEVDSGTMTLAGGGTYAGGTFNVNGSGSVLDLTGGSTTQYSGNFSGSGTGTVSLASGTLMFGAAGATFDFPAGLFVWSGGNLSTNTLNNSGFITLSSGNVKDMHNALVLNNSGTITDAGSNQWRFFDGSVLNNLSGGVVNMTTGETIINSNGSINNEVGATFKNSGPGSLTTVPFNNLGGIVEVDTGSFAIENGSSTGGIFNVIGASAELDLTGGTSPTYTGRYIGSGAGTVSLSSGTLNIGAAGATFNFPAGYFVWSGGSIDSNTLTNTGFITLSGGNVKDMDNGLRLNNAGAITDNGSNQWRFFGGSILNNQSGGVVNMASGETMVEGTGSFRNQAGGLFESTGPGSSTNLPFNNLGTFQISRGSFTFSGAVAQDSGTTLTGGTWIASGTGQIILPGGNFTENDGNVSISGSGSFAQINTVTTNAGSLSISGRPFNVAGNFQNSGKLAVDGVFNVAGKLTLTDSSALTLDIAGAPPTGMFGQIITARNAVLAGSLKITSVGGYGPLTGQLFTVGSYKTETGTFSSIKGDTLNGQNVFQVTVNATNVTVEALVTSADLMPTGISTSASASVGQPLTVNYTVTNVQTPTTAASSWVDSIYVSPDGLVDSTAVLLGTVAHVGALTGGASYTGTLTANVPLVLPGNDRVVVVADSGNQVPDSNRANNAVASTTTTAISIPSVSPGNSVATTISTRQSEYYVINAPIGSDIALTAALFHAGEAQVYVSDGAIPTTTTFDESGIISGNNLSVPILDSGTGPYVVLVQGLNTSVGRGGPVQLPITLGVRYLGFEIVSIAPVIAAPTGPAQVTISGSHFTANTTASLISADGTTITATSVQLENSNTLLATFDLTGASPDLYSVQINDSGQSFTDAFSFKVAPPLQTLSGAVNSDTELLSGTIYHITGTVTVGDNATLTIDPGAILKFDLDTGITVNSGSTLTANGTSAEPIVFTSIKDDAHGGDTNGDGNLTSPAAGDWLQILVEGTATFDHCQVLYGGGSPTGQWQSSGSIRVISGGLVNFSDGLMSQSFFDGFIGDGGTTNVTNSILVGIDRAIAGHSGGVMNVLNCTLDDNRIAVLGHGETATVTNCIITGSLNYGVAQDYGPVPTVSYTDVYTTVSGAVNYGEGATNQTGMNGNISADPKYVNAAAGDYRLNFLSPAIDAANGAVSPLTDEVGDARYNDPRTVTKKGVADGNGHFPDMGALEFEESAPSSIDLVAANVVGPPAAVSGQLATVTWTDANVGSGTAVGPWHDEIDLVLNPGPNQTVINVADVQVLATPNRRQVLANATLGPNQTFNLSAKVNVSGVLPGNYFWQVIPDATGDVFQGTNQGVGVGIASVATSVTLPMIPLNAAGVGASLMYPGQSIVFEVTPAQAQDLLISLSSSSIASDLQLYAAAGFVPTATNFQFKSQQFDSAAPTLDISSPAVGTPYFVTVYGRTLDASTVPFTLTATMAKFSLSAVSPGVIGNSGNVTIEVMGAGLAPGDIYQLVGPGGTFNDLSVFTQDSSTVFATFNIGGGLLGTYNLSVNAPRSAPARLSGAVNVVTTVQPSLSLQLLAPTAYREDRIFNGQAVYANQGNVDMPVPLLILTTGGTAQLSLDGTDFVSSDIDALAASFTGQAGVLRPGSQFSIPFSVLSTAQVTVPLAVNYDLSTDTSLVNYTTLGPEIKLSNYTTQQFNQAFMELQAEAGPTWGGLVTLLSQSVTYLQQENDPDFYYEYDAMGHAVENALQLANASALGTVYLNDTSHPLADVEVKLTNSGTGDGEGGVSGPDGTFIVDSLPASETYTVTVPGYLVSSPTTVTVPAGGMVSGLSIVVTAAEQISGDVANQSTGGGASGVTVDAVNATDGTVYEVATSADGSYALSGLTPGTYDLTAGGSTLEMAYVSGLTVAAGQSIAGENFALAASATVQGRVLNNSAGVAGAQVTLTDANGNTLSATTDASGNYLIANVTAGQYTLEAQQTGLASFQEPLTVAAGATTNVPNISLTAGAGFTVTVTDSGSHPINNAQVELLQSGAALAFASTGTNGQAQFTNIAAGTYSLQVVAYQFLTASGSVTLSDGGSSTNTVVLAPAGMISGTVKDGSGNPLANVPVLATPMNSENAAISTTTASDGSYSFVSLALDTYAVTIGTSPGIDRQQAVLSSGHNTATLAFTVAGVTLSGSVLKSNGTKPDTKASVALLQNGQILMTVRVDSGGNYSFEGLAAGAYDLIAGDATSLTAIHPLSIGTTNDSGVNLVIGSDTITGTVNSPTGQPQPGAVVILTPSSVSESVYTITATTDANGNFTATGLADGSYLLMAVEPGDEAQVQNINVGGGNPSAVPAITLGTGLNISGQVASSGTGVANAQIQVFNQANGQLVGAMLTDANGNYTVAALPAGTYDVVASAAGLRLTETDGLVIGASNVTVNFSLVAAGTQVSGTVSDNSSQPVAAATVTVLNRHGEAIEVVSTDFNGNYTITDLPAAKYTLAASASGFRAPLSGLSITLGASQTLGGNNLTLTAAAVDAGGSGGTPQVNYNVNGQSLTNVDQSFTGYLASFFTQNSNPEPMDVMFAPLPALGDCNEALLAFAKLVDAQSAADAAFNNWVNAHNDYNNKLGKLVTDGLINSVNVILSALPLISEAQNVVQSFKYQQIGYELAGAGELQAQLSTLAVNVGPVLAHVGTAIAQFVTAENNGGASSATQTLKNIQNVFNDIFTFASDGVTINALIGAGGALGSIIPGVGTALAAFQTLSQGYLDFQNFQATTGAVLNAQTQYEAAIRSYLAARRAFIDANNCPPKMPMPPPPPAPPNPMPGPMNPVQPKQSVDPNDLTSTGFGPQGFITGKDPITYTIDFENEANAGAPAQQVIVTDQLPATLKYSTVRLDSINFNNVTIAVPAGLSSFHPDTTYTVATDPTHPVTVDAEFNPATGLLTLTLTSTDPVSGKLTEDPSAGFLPPNMTPPDGEGYITFTASPAKGDTQKTPIINEASVVFDTNAAISTPTVTNTIDARPPTSTVAALPATEGSGSFTVNWSGSDGSGAGIQFFNVFVSDNGGAYTLFEQDEPATTTAATFNGQAGHSYAFYSVATDNVGNVQPTPTAGQATTSVLGTATISAGGVVSVAGTTVADTIKLSVSGTSLMVKVNSSKLSFPLASVTSIVVSGFAGNDSISVLSGVPAVDVLGGGGADTIVASNSAADTLGGGGGRDSIVGGGGHELLDGGNGADTLVAGTRKDSLTGDGGTDSLVGGTGASLLEGGDGNDTIVAGAGDSTLIAGNGNDSLRGNGGNDLLEQGPGMDTVVR